MQRDIGWTLRLINPPYVWTALALLLISVLAVPHSVRALQNLNGIARLSGILQTLDSVDTKSMDQQYTVNYSRSFLPYLQGRFALNYHDLQSRQTGLPNAWRGEIQPTADLSWANPLFSLGGNYRYREVRDFVPVNESLSRGAGLNLKTRFINLPQSSVQYDWNRNDISSGTIPIRSEERRFQYTGTYAYKTASLFYSFSQRRFENLADHLGYKQRQHIARADYSEALWANRLRFSGGYIFNYTQREETGPNAQLVTQIPASVGLYAHDETPDFGELDTLTTLINNDVIGATDPIIDIGGVEAYQNIGFGFVVPREINLIYIYTDTISASNIGWTVYTSDDNLSWAPLTAGSTHLYSDLFKRYEISFSPKVGRYFKAVKTGNNDHPRVYVTEIQALSTEIQSGPDRSENHRANLNLSFQASKALRLALDAAAGTLLEDQTTQQRHEVDVTGTAVYRPTSFWGAVAKAQHSLANYVSNEIPLQETDSYSLIFTANPLPTLEASLSGAQTTTQEDNRDLQRTTSSLWHTSAILFPGLATVWEVGFAHDERPQTAVEIDTWSGRISADANPYQSLSLGLNYSAQRYASNQASAAEGRDQLESRFTYRLTAGISLRGGVLWAREDNYETTEQDYAASWSLSERFSAGANVRWEDASNNYHTETLSLQSAYIFSPRTSVFFSYSMNKIEQAQIEENTAYQMGFTTGF